MGVDRRFTLRALLPIRGFKQRRYLRPMRWIMCVLFLLVGALASFGQAVIAQPCVFRDTLTLLDTTRHRPIPVAIYRAEVVHMPEAPLVIYSHGWNENKPGTYLGYGWLMEALAEDGAIAVSVQHELPTDPLLPMKGDLQVERAPSWDRGVNDLLYVLSALQRRDPELGQRKVVLIGHSQGGDIAMRFATRYPDRIVKVISLDNRRMPLPRTAQPRVYSLRSNDQPADPGVLPTPEEQERYGITVVPCKNIGHNAMGQRGTPEQEQELLGYIRRFLAE